MAADPVTATVHVDAPPERVWEYFTKPDAIVRWMGEYALLEPEPGGQFTVNVQGTPVRGRFLSLESPRRLVISWGYAGSERLPPGASIVEIWLTPDGAGTRVDLEHRQLPAAEKPGHVTGWAHYLARLAAAVTGQAGPDPGMGHVPAPPSRPA
jgi:uncharacterized protein YndB with AHSA1/START domain